MPLPIYHILHIVGVATLFIAFGALLSGYSKSVMKWHGASLLVMLITGFGMLAKLGIMGSMPAWAWVKIAIFIVMGALPSFVKRGALAPKAAVTIALFLLAFAAYIGYFKALPF
jgi:hypothetical protein